MGDYLHGAETLELFAGPTPMRSPRSAVIGLVGTAPIQSLGDPDDATVNQVVLCKNEVDDAKYFGADTTGYTIPSALKAIRAQGSGLVLVINVFDPTLPAHQTAGSPDVTKVAATDIIGTTNGSGIRSGMQAWFNSRAQFGFTPRILIAPGFSSTATVAAALRVISPKLRATDLVDAAVGTTFSAALAGRTGVGHVYNTASDRSLLLYPYLQAAGPGGMVTNQPYSQFMAGVIAAKDQAVGGPHWSPSNTVIQGVVGVERLLTASITDRTTEVQLLNAQGITTYFPEGGIRTWGNRSAAFPTILTPNNFYSIRRTADIIEDAIELAQLQHQDKPLTRGVIDQVVEDVNGYLREKRGDGWIIDGKCWFDPDDNPITKLGNGNPTYRYNFLPPGANELASFIAVIDSNYLKQLLGA